VESKIWRRLRDALEGGMRQQITRSGLLFTVTIALVGLAAFASANNLMFLLLAALLATLLISGLVSRLGLAGLELDLALPEQIAARRKVPGQLVLTNRKSWVPTFSVHLSGAPETGMPANIYIPVLPGGRTLREPVDLFFARRGVYRDSTFSFTSRFPFGFTQRRAMVQLDREVLVYPCIDAQPGFESLLADVAGEIESWQQGRGHDFYRIRPYEAMESARHVDWKATAHTGELQVREFAREQDRAVTIFLDLDVPDSRLEWFEKAVDCCAFLVWRLAEHDLRLRLLTQQFDRLIPDDSDVHNLLKYLAMVSPVRGAEPLSPDEDHSVEIAISVRPSRLLEAGWTRARILGVDDFTAALAAGNAPSDS
jgi:uncharacterized protein (DUF58 family)